MPAIHQLSPSEIQKIAAGEVVERPANVVKELVENALDASATHVTVMIEDGGKKSIRIIDNGRGMDQIDAHLCFDHHATSKITVVDDLQTIATYGFRGEALSSIASVSKVTLVTKQKDDEFATKLVLEANTVCQESQVHANAGTDIAVENLFFNVPARLKFLKTRETEWRQILHFMQAIIFAYRHVHIELIADGQTILNCPPQDSLIARCAQIWDFSTSEQMIPCSIDDEARHIVAEGFISRQQYARYDRSQIFLFTNSRWIKNNHLTKALLKGYLNSLPPARFPAGAIFITIDPAEIDVNIHPRKEEVKFLHSQIVDNLIFNVVKQTLESQLSKSTIAHKQAAVMLPPSDPFSSDSEIIQTFSRNNFDGPVIARDISIEQPRKSFDEVRQSQDLSLQERQISIEKKEIEQQAVLGEFVDSEPALSIIGQFNKTYIIVQQNEELVFFDQHAAHERILYELFAHRFNDVAIVKLLFPLLISVSAEQAEIAENFSQLFESYGLPIERFGATQLRLLATPVHLQERAPQEIIKQIIGWIAEEETTGQELSKLLNEKIHAKMACVAAVKAGDELSREQMQQLITDLLKTQNNITCPHGRPTSWRIDLHELEKKFKRDYRSAARMDGL